MKANLIRTKQKAPVKSRGRVGRPPSGKIIVTLRLEPDVVAKFKATGSGWQSRINDTLKKNWSAVDIVKDFAKLSLATASMDDLYAAIKRCRELF